MNAWLGGLALSKATYRLRLVTSQGSPYPSRSPRAHPSGWTRTQGLSRRDSHAPPSFCFLGRPSGCGTSVSVFTSIIIIFNLLQWPDTTHAAVIEIASRALRPKKQNFKSKQQQISLAGVCVVTAKV